MPLVPATLQQQLEQLYDEMMQISDPNQARAHYTSRLAVIITNYIKTATVTVATTGTAAAQTGTGTIT